MNKPTWDENTWEQICNLKGLGFSTKDISDKMGVSEVYINRLMSILNLVATGDFDLAIKRNDQYGLPKLCLEWIAKKCNVPITALEKKPDKNLEKKPERVPSIDYSLYLIKLLETVKQTNELLNQLMEVVVPKYVSDIKNNQNVNFDVVCQSQKRMEDQLEGIKISVRKSGK